MSRTPFFYVEKLNKYTDKYELQHPIIWNYNHTKQEMADLFPYNGCHDLFAIIEEKTSFSSMPMNGIHRGLPKDVCEEIKNEYQKNYQSDYNMMPTVRWFTYADMYIYYLKYPKLLENGFSDDVIDDEERENPIKILMDRVNAFLEVMNEWGWQNDYSLIRIVYWID